MKDTQMEGDASSTGNNELSGEGKNAGDKNTEQPISNQSNSEIEEISLKGLVVKSPDKSIADVEYKKDDTDLKSLVRDENINPAIKFRCPFCDLIVCGNAEFLKHILRHGENCKTDDKTTKQSDNDKKPDKIAIKNSKRLKFRLSHPSIKSSSTISQLPRSKQTKSSDPPISKSKAPPQAIKKNKKIPCKICKNMYYAHYMSSHMTVHTGERNFSCLFCPQAFAVYCNLKAHMGSLHKKTLNLASYRELSAEKSKLKQNQVKNSIASATATTPRKTFSPETETPVDAAANTEPEPSTELNKRKSKTVPKCKKTLEKSSNRRNFQRPQGKSYKCQQCPKRFKAQSTLKYHQFTHSEERPFKCQFCDVACRHPSNLNKHIKLRHKNEKQVDNFKAIESVPSKKRSTRITSAVEINSYDSKQEEDSNAISLIQKDEETELQMQKTRETRKRKGPKPFPSLSPPTSSLKKKRRKGKRSEKIQCWFPNCGKIFGSNQALEIHYRVHTKEKPYHCDTCSKKFSQISSLQRHKKIVHLGIKSYKCPYCDKATSSSWNDSCKSQETGKRGRQSKMTSDFPLLTRGRKMSVYAGIRIHSTIIKVKVSRIKIPY